MAAKSAVTSPSLFLDMDISNMTTPAAFNRAARVELAREKSTARPASTGGPLAPIHSPTSPAFSGRPCLHRGSRHLPEMAAVNSSRRGYIIAERRVNGGCASKIWSIAR